MKRKLDYLLENKELMQNISERGYEKLIEGYSIKKSSIKLLNSLNKNIYGKLE